MKKIIIFILAFVGFFALSPFALAYMQCGTEVSACSIQKFSFSTGITPACFQSATNISTAAGWCDILQIASNVIGLLYSLALPLAVLMISVGGFIILTVAAAKAKHKTREVLDLLLSALRLPWAPVLLSDWSLTP